MELGKLGSSESIKTEGGRGGAVNTESVDSLGGVKIKKNRGCLWLKKGDIEMSQYYEVGSGGRPLYVRGGGGKHLGEQVPM